jgi:hypothetical protein
VTKPIILTVNGTGDPAPDSTMGFSGLLGSIVGGLNPWEIVANQISGLSNPVTPWNWMGIGYPAALINMQTSVNNARAQLQAALGAPTPTNWYGGPVYQGPIFDSGPFALSGYSQGAIATGQCFQKDILDPGGVLHNRLADCLSVVNFGDPLRCPGIANGNSYQGLPVPGTTDGFITGGIGGPIDLTAAQTNAPNSLGDPIVMSYALPGDLYAAAPVGSSPWTNEADPGKVGTSIYNVILHATFIDVISVAGDLFVPVGMVEEIINGIGFLAAGNAAPHWQYWNAGCVSSAAQYLIGLASQL